MANGGVIRGTMVLDPTQYIAGLNQAAAATRSFQTGASHLAFAGFNRGVIATTTLLYGLNHVMSSMSRGMEEYSVILGKIGTVADLTASSVQALANSMKSVSVAYGVSRKDIMGAMYTSAQSRFSTPAEMRAMATAGALMTHASGIGSEISVKEATSLLAGLRQAFGISMDAVTSGRMVDLLIRGRDVGKWELKEMRAALGKVSTVYGNQFKDKLGGEEVLRQLVAMMSVTSLSDLPLNTVSTGTRRLVEKTLKLANSEKGRPLASALLKRGFGKNGENPILDALNRGPLNYGNTLLSLTGSGKPEELSRYGYEARELQGLTSLLRDYGGPLNATHKELSYANIAGTGKKYAERLRNNYGYTRQRLRSEWEITSQEFMAASIPLIGQFTSALESLNKVAQALPTTAKSFLMLISAITSARFFLNLLGIRSTPSAIPKGFTGAIPGGPMAQAMQRQARAVGMAGGAKAPFGSKNHPIVAPADAAAARQARRLAAASSRSWTARVGISSPTAYVYPQDRGISAIYRENESLRAMAWLGAGSGTRYTSLIGARYTDPAANYTASAYGPTLQQRIRWAAYRRGESVDFDNGTYGSLSQRAAAYRNRSVPQGSLSVRELRGAVLPYAASLVGRSNVMVRNIGTTTPGMRGYEGGPSFINQLGRYSSASAAFGTAGYIPSAADYAGMGIGKSAQAIGAVTARLSSLTSGLWAFIGPMVKLGAILKVVGSFIEGVNYKGSPGAPISGKKPFDEKGEGDYGISDWIDLQVSRLGRWSAGGQYDNDLVEDFARKYGYVPGIEQRTRWEGAQAGAKGGELAVGAGTWAVTGNPLLAIPGVLAGYFGGGAYGAIAPNRTSGLYGFRPGSMLDVGGITAREQLTPNEVTRLWDLGIDFDKPESWTPKLNKYVDEHFDRTPPQDWDAYIKQHGMSVYQLSEYLRDALRSFIAETDRATAATKAKTDAEEKSEFNTKKQINIRPWLAYNSAYETIMGLEGTGAKPFQRKPTAEWKAKYAAGLDAFLKRYPEQEYSEEYLMKEFERASSNEILSKAERNTLRKPFNDTIQTSNRLKRMRFLAENAFSLGSMNDETLISQFGLDSKHIPKDMMGSILSRIRGLDPTQWAETTFRDKAPFSAALQYGSREGYNATLERKDDFAVQVLAPKLQSLIDKVIATKLANDEADTTWHTTLKDTISTASTNIVNAINGANYQEQENWLVTDSE